MAFLALAGYALDAAFADAVAALAKRHPADDFVQVLHAEAIMDTQPWDYWEAAGAKPKGRAGDLLAALEKVLARNPGHTGAIHLYIHAVEASTKPERALPHAVHAGYELSQDAFAVFVLGAIAFA